MTENESSEMNDTKIEDTQEGKYLTFVIGEEEFGIEIRDVTEIIGIQNITVLPGVPHYLKGVINLRGKVIPVVDIRLRFNLEERKYDACTCIIVVNIDNRSVGMIVDEVSEVLDIPAEQIEPTSSLSQQRNSEYIQGFGKIDEGVKILLNTSSLLFTEELEMLDEVVAA